MKISSSFKICSHENKLLIDHLKNVAYLSRKFIRDLNLDFENKSVFEEAIYLIGVSHDFAKATTFFQKKLCDKKYETEKADHSYLSSIFSYWLVKRYLEDKYENGDYIKYLPYFAWLIVAKHHGDLENWFNNGHLFERIKDAGYIEEQIIDICGNSLDELQRIYDILLKEISFRIDIKNFLENYQEIFFELEEDLEENFEKFLLFYRNNINLEKYLEFLLLYSSLIDADKFDASCETREFDEIKGILFDRKNLSENLVDNYKKVMFSISKPIDRMREKTYNEIIRNIDKINLDRDKIFSINLPTGSGKTLSAFSFALKLRNKLYKEKGIRPRIIYSLPFLSIIDQNAKVISEIVVKEMNLDWRDLAHLNERDKIKILEEKIPTDLLLKHHHLADIKYVKKRDNGHKEEFEKDRALLLMDGWYSEIIITTFVQFFQSLITSKNSAIRKIHNIANSIIILDEFQSIPYEYWGITRELLKSLATKWNCYVIVMTATMPMILEEECVIPLIKNPDDYFENINFNRVDIFIDKKEKKLEHFIDEISNRILKSQEDILIILNTVKSSQEIYSKIREKLVQVIGKPKITEEGIAEFGELYLINLNANIIPFHRLQRIDKIKNSDKRKIIISTQLVEAGVDIDIDIIYRDLAPIDSLVQSAGRCNRNNLKSKGKVHIIDLIDENRRKFSIKIYGEILIQATENILKDYSKIEESNVKDVVKKYFREIKEERKYTEGKKFIEQTCNLEFDKIKDFSLIKKEFGRRDICVLVHEVKELIEKIERLKKELAESDYKDRFKIVPEIKSLRRKLEQFIISPFLGEKESILRDTYNDKLSLYILDPMEREIYQKEMGFFINEDNNVLII